VALVHLWYAAYGSNLSRARFLAYIQGGRPEGATRTYPGARDRTEPLGERAFTMPGSVFFAWTSPTWGGGIAFYDPDAEGSTLARAYLISEGQFADLAAQEMHRQPGADLDLDTVLERRRHVLGPGRYESLHLVGELDGHPVLTFTAPEAHGLEPNAPSGAYLSVVARGLEETHGLDPDALVAYLAGCHGLGDAWTPEALRKHLF
jgi:hypothetical protein